MADAKQSDSPKRSNSDEFELRQFNISGRIIRQLDNSNRIREIQFPMLNDARRRLSEMISRSVGLVDPNCDYFLIHRDGPSSLHLEKRVTGNRTKVVKNETIDLDDDVKKQIVGTVNDVVSNFLERFIKDGEKDLPDVADRVSNAGLLNFVKSGPIKWLEEFVNMYVNFERKTVIDLAHYLLLSNNFNLHNIIFGVDLIVRCGARFSQYSIFSGKITNREKTTVSLHLLVHKKLSTMGRIRTDFRIRLEDPDQSQKSRAQTSRKINLNERSSCRSDASVINERVVIQHKNTTGIEVPDSDVRVKFNNRISKVETLKSKLDDSLTLKNKSVNSSFSVQNDDFDDLDEISNHSSLVKSPSSMSQIKVEYADEFFEGYLTLMKLIWANHQQDIDTCISEVMKNKSIIFSKPCLRKTGIYTLSKAVIQKLEQEASEDILTLVKSYLMTNPDVVEYVTRNLALNEDQLPQCLVAMIIFDHYRDDSGLNLLFTLISKDGKSYVNAMIEMVGALSAYLT